MRAIIRRLGIENLKFGQDVHSVTEIGGIDLGVFTQKLGAILWLVAYYFSKQLDSGAAVRSACFREVSAPVLPANHTLHRTLPNCCQ